MEKQAKTIIFLIVLFSLLVGCSETTSIISKEALDEKSIPIPKVVTEETVIPVKQSSYCWGTLGCGDYVGGKAMLNEETPTVVMPEAKIKVSYDYEPAPSQVGVQQYIDEDTVDVPLKEGYFMAPKDKGIYYYRISAFWTSEDGKYSKGDTSSVFLIEVK